MTRQMDERSGSTEALRNSALENGNHTSNHRHVLRHNLPVRQWLDVRLGQRGRYEDQIDRLHGKHLLTQRMFTLQQDGVPLATLVRDRSRLSRALSSSVAGGSYESHPATMRDLVVEGKRRRVFSYRLTDVIVHGVVADLLQEGLDVRLSPRVFSYRKGVSWWAAVAEFAAYLRCHRRSQADPSTRGMYVLRRDVSSYADTIPMAATSRIWEMVRAHLESPGGAQIAPEHWALIERAVRPEYFADGRRARASRVSGVATGQQIACVLFNLYLADVDRALDRIPGGFYARYSDDLIFAHPDPDVVQQAARSMTEVLSQLGLRFNEAKITDQYLTRPGRPSAAWPDATGTSAITFLGTRISADGDISIKSETVRHLMADLEQRARNAARALATRDLDTRGRVVCAVVNRLLDPDATPDGGQGAVALLRHAVTDREQLAQLDYHIARLVLRVVTGDRGVRAFRRVPYRTIREEWRLRSLLHVRNRLRRKAA